MRGARRVTRCATERLDLVQNMRILYYTYVCTYCVVYVEMYMYFTHLNFHLSTYHKWSEAQVYTQ